MKTIDSVVNLFETPDKLLDATVNQEMQQRYQGHGYWSVSKTVSREKIGEIFNPRAHYTFFRTIANPLAQETLLKYIGTRKDNSPWEIALKKPGDDPVYVPGASDRGNGLWFSPGVHDTYLATLDELASVKLGKKSHRSFPLLPIKGHNHDRPRESIFFPIIHVVKNCDREFTALVDQLNGDEAYEILKRREAPQNYKRGEIDTLRLLNIPPLLLQDRTWKVDGEQLHQALDFLTPFEVTYSSRNESFVDDD